MPGNATIVIANTCIPNAFFLLEKIEALYGTVGYFLQCFACQVCLVRRNEHIIMGKQIF